MSELLRALAVVAEPPAPESDRVCRLLRLPARASESEWTELFLFQLPPYASIYLGPEGMIGGESRDRVAGFWRALGLEPPAEPDHLAALLGLYVTLCERGQAEGDPARRRLARVARRALLGEHLLSWLPLYLDKVREIGTPAYRAWARLLEEALASEAEELGSLDRLPAHLRAVPPLASPAGDGARTFLAALLAPARSGTILTRADLARAADQLGLGLRGGSRRLALEALLAQDAPATLAWLAAETGRAAGRLRRHGVPDPVRTFWQERAVAAAALLAELRVAAEEKEVVHAG